MHEAAQNFEVVKYSVLKLKNKKHIAVDVLLKGYHSHADPIRPDGTVPLITHKSETPEPET